MNFDLILVHRIELLFMNVVRFMCVCVHARCINSGLFTCDQTMYVLRG